MGNICNQICLQAFAFYFLLKSCFQSHTDIVDVGSQLVFFSVKIIQVYLIACLTGRQMFNCRTDHVMLNGMLEHKIEYPQVEGRAGKDYHTGKGVNRRLAQIDSVP